MVTGVHGTAPFSEKVYLEDMTLLEFSPTRKISGPLKVTVFDNPDSTYDIIMGMDLLQLLHIDVKSSTKTVEWGGLVIPFRPRHYLTTPLMHDSLTAFMEDEDCYYGDATGYHSRDILPSEYEEFSPWDVASRQTHLTKSQKDELARLLAEFPQLFSNKLMSLNYRSL